MNINMNVLRRLGAENNELIRRNEKITWTKNEDDNLIFIEIESKHGNKFLFDIDMKFPFRPPKNAMVNNKNYFSVLQLIKPYKKLLKELDGRECLCCSSILCENNWGPARRLWELVDEGDEIINIKKKIFYVFYARYIASNFLTHDIPLEQYL